MTIEQLKTLPRRMSDLATLRVGTWSEYTDFLLRDYGIDAVPFEWESIEDERRMMDALVGGEIDALVLDEPLLRYLDANNCSTVFVESIKPVQVQGLHTGFPVTASPSTVDAYNLVLQDLLERDQLNDLREKFVYQEGLACKSSAASENAMLVTWDDVAGLWLMLAVSIGLALVVMGSFRLWNHWLSKTRMFRKTSQVTRAWSGQLQSVVDKNLSASMERETSQRGGEWGRDPEMRDLVLALQKQLAGVEALIKEQKRQGF